MKVLSQIVPKLWQMLKFSDITFWYERKGHHHKKYIHVCEMAKVFRYVGQRSQSMSRHQQLWYDQKGLVTRNVHVKYESSISCVSKVMANVKICRYMYVGQRSR